MNCRMATCNRLLVYAFSALALAAAATVNADQLHFAAAEQAADTFVVAIARGDQDTLEGLFGRGYLDYLPIDEVDTADIDRFLAAWTRHHTLLSEGEGIRMLEVGDTGWTLPIPIVQDPQGWRFDTQTGRETMRIRRIGRNELSAMQAALAYHDAQTEYAQRDHDGNGVLEYAQRFISTPGKRDGLYWEASKDEAESPLGALFSEKTPEKAYHGYYYRILSAQGKHAEGGQLDYKVNGNMVGGFGLVAWPAEYGESGVMSFMLNKEGVLYETDLGPEGGEAAGRMLAFDPDSRWVRVSPVFSDPE
ncbi:MAG: DUF2950 domain-containing protein [Gammaproteobacteria bacterium]|nr:DUF2950 domain-containing protein [Gammaproteobacteria bacterium]